MSIRVVTDEMVEAAAQALADKYGDSDITEHNDATGGWGWRWDVFARAALEAALAVTPVGQPVRRANRGVQ
jgi:hypothetical protein